MNVFENVEEVNRIARWYLGTNRRRYHLCMRVGGVNDVINEMWLGLIRYPPPAGTRLMTAVRNQSRWAIGNLRRQCRHLDVQEVEISEAAGVACDAVNPVSAAADVELREAIERVLRTLTYRERSIIELRYGLGDGWSHTLEEVGRIFKVTRERVRQTESKALMKLQHETRAAMLSGFVNSKKKRRGST